MTALEATLPDARDRHWPLALVLAVFTLFGTVAYVNAIPFNGEAPDELAHAGYIHDIAQGSRLLPDYSDGHQLYGGREYLNHPPLYYTINGLIGRTLGWSLDRDYKNYRLLSALMVSAGIFFWVLTCLTMGLKRVWVCAIIAATIGVPMFSYLAAVINNDNLAYLGVAIFFFGLSHLKRFPRTAWYIVAAGAIVTFLTKATASLFLVAFVASWLIIRIKDGDNPLRQRRCLIAMISVIVVCAAYYIPTLVAYGTPFPSAITIRGSWPPPTHPLTLIQYTVTFVTSMMASLPNVLTAHANFAVSPAVRPVFYAMLALPIACWLLTRPHMRSSPNRHICDACIVALAITVGCHIFVMYHYYLQHGVLAGMQPRYYNYALPGFFLVGFIGGGSTYIREVFFLAFSVIAAVVVTMTLTQEIPRHTLMEGRRNISHISVSAPLATLDPESKRKLSPLGTAGYIDDILVNNGSMTAHGWAIDVKSKSPAVTVWIILDGGVVGTIPTNAPRPDVVRATHSRSSLLSGFRVDVSGVPKGAMACDFVFAAQQASGKLAVLSNNRCH